MKHPNVHIQHHHRKKTTNEQWKILYTNIRGLKGKKTGLTEILLQEQPHVCLLTETQLRSNINVQVKGYTFYSKKREEKLGGGVAILIRNDKRFSVACHMSERNIECMWISIRKSGLPPFFIGTYYGKQETRTSVCQIETEMHLLKEELLETLKEGELLLVMDGNAKIGILNEPVSRNGRHLLKVIEDTNLIIMNKSDKCCGKITRQNTKKASEFSAIDFVLTSENAEKWINDILIDENGLYKIKGKNETDHNTILINLCMRNIDNLRPSKTTNWNLRAGPEKWKEYERELRERTVTATNIINDPSIDINQRYKKWYKQIEDAARKTIGKTTFKEKTRISISKTLRELNEEKKAIKQQIKTGKTNDGRKSLIEMYKKLQEKAKNEIHKEKIDLVKRKYEKIINDGSNNALWKEKKSLSRNPALENLIIKDKDGNRQYTPDDIKQHTANYYETLYKNKTYKYHPYHKEAKDRIQSYMVNKEYDNDNYNQLPSIEEIHEIIQEKKNGKSTTDIKNEMLKRPGEIMTTFIYPLIETIWNEETIPQTWNKGHVTSLWKGKGDKEKLENYRGITTSSAIGTILESVIDRRIERMVKFTQAQGGGKRKASTFDHLFIARAITDIAIKQKREIYITFYDVAKAYDNANNEDMLSVLWERGLKGKTWRILHNLSINLTAQVKTRFGPTRQFNMEIGGRQGSRLTGRMFSKTMDVLAEECIEEKVGVKLSPDLVIPVLLWVDDVLSCAEGVNEQHKMLERIDVFATKHRLKWGETKCNVMRVGNHPKNPNTSWKLGDMPIKETKSYKYLGDILCSNGKNEENIKSRKVKTLSNTAHINAIGATDVLRMIETKILLELHDKVTVPGLITNAESWSLNKGEMDEIEKTEIQAIKHLLDLPIHTPTPAIIFSFGLLYTKYRIEMKRLIYLHKILNKYESHWTKITLTILDTLKIGWARTIRQSLTSLDLPTDFQAIRCIPRNQWKKTVKAKIEVNNTTTLIEQCHKRENGVKMKKTKTAHILDQISTHDYERGLRQEYASLTRHETKTLLLARFHMLECGVNFKGTMSVLCKHCKVTDDENHRLNNCKVYRSINHYDDPQKVNFSDVYSHDVEVIKVILKSIERVWNTKTSNGTMHK